MKNTISFALLLLLSVQTEAACFSPDSDTQQREFEQALIDCKNPTGKFKGYIQYEGGSSSGEDGIIAGYTPHPDGKEFGFIITAKKIIESSVCKTFDGKRQLVNEVKADSHPELFFCGKGSSFKILAEDQHIVLGDSPILKTQETGFRGCGGGRDGQLKTSLFGEYQKLCIKDNF